MDRIILYPYKMGSKSCKELSKRLGTKQVHPDGKYSPYRNHMIVNWGSSHRPEFLDRPATANGRFVNHWESVIVATNKLKAFERMKEFDVSIPAFTADPAIAREWIHNEQATVVSRYKLTGHSGEGIELCDDYDRFLHKDKAPLYVKYIKKNNEYRIHVFDGEVIDVQHKRKRREVPNEEVDYRVRNHGNGWIFARDDIDPPHPEVITVALQAVEALGLDFGAVDVIYNDHHEQAYVLEVNCAPGLEGQTLDNYAQALTKLARGG